MFLFLGSWLIYEELETAVETFRQALSDAYVRQKLCVLALEYPDPILLSRLTIEDIKNHKDVEWIEREKSYHDAAVKELNNLVRKYNTFAPYSVRRSLYNREVEVGKLAEGCAEKVFKKLKERDDALSYQNQRHSLSKGPREGFLVLLQNLVQMLFQSKSR